MGVMLVVQHLVMHAKVTVILILIVKEIYNARNLWVGRVQFLVVPQIAQLLGIHLIINIATTLKYLHLFYRVHVELLHAKEYFSQVSGGKPHLAVLLAKTGHQVRN